jgi:hypothetical protein
MSDLLKRADLFNANSDGISGKNPADAKLVGELADRIRYLEAPTLSKRVAVGFFQYWWNTSGTNTNQGFDEYWNKLLMNELELPSEAGVEVELGTIPIDRGRDADRRYHRPHKERVPTPEVPEEELESITRSPTKPITLENLEKDWLSGTTCHRQRRTVHWVSDDGQWIVMKHHGHSEWCGGWSGNQYCGTRYDLFRVGDEFPRTIDQSPYFTQESRWSKESMKWVEKVMAGWRPLNFVETQ